MDARAAGRWVLAELDVGVPGVGLGARRPRQGCPVACPTAKPAGSHCGLGAVAAVTLATARRFTAGGPHGRGHYGSRAAPVVAVRSEARSAHSVAAYAAAEMTCLPGHKALKDRKAVRLVARCQARPGLLIECSA